MIGQHQHFGRAGDHVDAHRAENLFLCCRHKGIARTDNLGDRGDGLCAIGQGCNGLRPADTVNLGNTGEPCSGQNQGIEDPVRTGNNHDNALNPGNLCRHGVHQHRAWIAGAATGHIKADRFNRRPARAQTDTQFIFVIIIPGHLPGVMLADTLVRQFQRLHGLFVDLAKGRVNFIG